MRLHRVCLWDSNDAGVTKRFQAISCSAASPESPESPKSPASTGYWGSIVQLVDSRVQNVSHTPETPIINDGDSTILQLITAFSAVESAGSELTPWCLLCLHTILSKQTVKHDQTRVLWPKGSWKSEHAITKSRTDHHPKWSKCWSLRYQRSATGQ